MDNREKKLKRLKIQSWRRGMKEVDLLLGGFVDQNINSLSDKDIKCYEQLLLQDDQLIYFWISKPSECPKNFISITKKISQFAIKKSNFGL